jgi:S-formylglutathione hydrolase FrmB
LVLEGIGVSHLAGAQSAHSFLIDMNALFERWIGAELPDLLAQTELPVTLSSHFFIGGLSMGGFGALRIGAIYSGRFLAISAHSSVTHLDALRRFSDEDVAAAAEPGDASALDAILANRTHLPALRFDCGLDDPLLQDNRALHAALDHHGIAHVYQEFAGGHEWPYWERHLQDTLRFFARGLVR